MAGSLRHIMDAEGQLLSAEGIRDRLDTVGDMVEALQQMHGIIIYLATWIEDETGQPKMDNIEVAEEMIRRLAVLERQQGPGRGPSGEELI